MPTLEVGTSVDTDECTANISCYGNISQECSQFIDNGDGVKVYHLYKADSCSYIPPEISSLYYRPVGSTDDWLLFDEQIYDGYGYIYFWWVLYAGSGYEWKVTWYGLTKYYTIVSPDDDDMGYRMISPVGEGTTCLNIIALLFEDKKYWVDQEEYQALGSPAWEEISLDEFNSYPDGTTPISINGVTIVPKDTSICQSNIEEETDMNKIYALLAGVGIGTYLLLKNK